MTVAVVNRNPQGRVRRDWASMTAAVVNRNPQGRVRRDWASMTAAVVNGNPQGRLRRDRASMTAYGALLRREGVWGAMRVFTAERCREDQCVAEGRQSAALSALLIGRRYGC